RQGAGRLRQPQPGRARGARLHPAEAPADREGFPGEERLPSRLHAVRLASQRPDRSRWKVIQTWQRRHNQDPERKRRLRAGGGTPARNKKMHLELDGKIAIVTGSSKGLGLACATALVEEGCRVTICARGEEALAAAHARLRGLTGGAERVLAVKADVSTEAGIADVIDRSVERFG